MLHKEQSSLAGQTVRIKASSKHHQFANFAGSDFVVEDWWDRVSDESWTDSNNSVVCFAYNIRRVPNNLPLDDEVLYGHIGSYGHLVHVSEIETSKK